MPGRHSLFWKLAALLIGFCLLMIWLSWSWGRYMEARTAFLSPQAHASLSDYARAAERALDAQGPAGLDNVLRSIAAQEGVFVTAIGPDFAPLGQSALSVAQRQRLTSLRGIDWPVSRRSTTAPWLRVPFPQHAEGGMLVIELPQRFMPGRYGLFWHILTNGIVPALFTLLLCIGLYRMLVAPLEQLRRQAQQWRADRLDTRLEPGALSRKDELGELARAFDDMGERLHRTVTMQQRLLHDLSHELRTPLSRLRVACEAEPDNDRLRERLAREVDNMQRLVEDALQLAWLDAERSPPKVQPIQITALWDVLAEDAAFETGWLPERLHCAIPETCWVRGHLNSLAQAVENVLRNAIRHSPPGARVSFSAEREGDHWRLSLQDHGGGVPEADLSRMFDPFTRLDGARPGDGGFGLGLSIARHAIERQGGTLVARNAQGGLRVELRLPASEPAATSAHTAATY